MSFIAFVRTAWAAVWTVYRFIKELDKSGVAYFSDEWWLALRTKILAKVIEGIKGNDKGWRKLIKTDDQFLHGITLLMKSERLNAIENAAGSTLGRLHAEQVLLGDPHVNGNHVP